jgi:hypothetical protein
VRAKAESPKGPWVSDLSETTSAVGSVSRSRGIGRIFEMSAPTLLDVIVNGRHSLARVGGREGYRTDERSNCAFYVASPRDN